MWRQTIVQEQISIGKITAYLSNTDKSGDTKNFVATIVTNVTTKIIWLDTTALAQRDFEDFDFHVITRNEIQKLAKETMFMIKFYIFR